ncbi:hypothetical protein GCM10009716_21150 [Streptomyces sodiiphilus]|uniref:Uncharacterized protein n=1 Tax=Streptomyces sodiiphilus TaxID=226217 RepID=A0ABN2P5K1_9ACTN
MAREGDLELRSRAVDRETLDRVEGVVGRHLEKFGARADLVVAWERT